MQEVLRAIPIHTLFKEGDLLIYSNYWSSWKKPEGQKWHEWLTFEECAALQPGDQVWVDDEPYVHSLGKVYGDKLVTISGVEKVNDFTVRIFHSSGMNTQENVPFIQFSILTDEQRVWDWTKDELWAREC
ncbi:MAG: hypothetical protein AAB618_02830 [Patescibacteria group bacterium]